MHAARLIVLLVLPLTAGCVHRVLRIESVPTGAEITIDGVSAGTTPADVPFVWYGTREISLEKRGYQSVTVMESVLPPWWQIFPLDFVTDVLLPVPLWDVHELRYTLEPFGEGPEDYEETLRRAEEFKRKAHED
ncbi:MAG: PEGA domain-containing protein [Planctomycetota bacterium]